MSEKYMGAFSVEDATFRDARKQSKVAEELAEEKGIEIEEIGVPVSMTPEAVIRYLEERAEVSNENERRVLEQSAKWIRELFELKRSMKSSMGRGEDVSS